MFCTGCGNTIYEDDIFCSVCGKKRTPRPSAPNAQAPHKPPQAVPPFRRPPENTPQDYVPPRRRPPTEYDMPARERRRGGSLQTVIAVVCIVLLVFSLSVIGFSLLRNHQTGVADTPNIPPANGADDTNVPTENGTDDSNQSDTPAYTPPPDPEADSTGSLRFPFPGILSRYTTNTADISFLQNTLNTIRSYYTSVRPIDVASGNFDGATRGAVIDFQQRAGLTPTGIVDEATWYSLIAVFENPPETPDPPFTPPVNTGYVTLVNLHLREGPSQSAYSLGIKPEGTPVHVVSYIPGSRWFFVTISEYVVGYMKAEFLLLEGIL